MFDIIRKLKHADQYTNFVIKELYMLDLDGDFFRVFVYYDDLEIPIFHMVDSNTYNDVGVCIFEPRYYKYNRGTVIDRAFLPEYLDRALREPDEEFPEYTRWDRIVKVWKDGHNTDVIDEPKIQPDYSKLDRSKFIRRSFTRMLIAKWNA